MHSVSSSPKSIVVTTANSSTGEVVGFGTRIASHFDNASWGPFIVQGVFLLVGPLFFAATIYMMLGRTIRLAGGEEVSLIKPMWYTRLFVGADISTLVIQGFGITHRSHTGDASLTCNRRLYHGNHEAQSRVGR